MPDALRIVQVNLAYDASLSSPEAMLSAYHTLTGWSRAVTRAGATVEVVQRFSVDGTLDDAGVRYRFVVDDDAGTPGPWDLFERVTAAVEAVAPNVVHVNGLMFPGMVASLRARLPHQTAIVVQDHSGSVPRQAPWPWRSRAAARWRRATNTVDAWTFTAAELAERWHTIGLARDSLLLEIPEASTSIVPVEAPDAVTATGIHASPAILWVGRLNANKDPLTVLDALESARARLPTGHCWMVFNGGDLERDVVRRIAASPTLRACVTLVGPVPHFRVAAYYSASDIFVSGSRHEGSGYALLEAMACGLTPCVTDIPAFRALTGRCGVRWLPGDATACANALLEVSARDHAIERRAVQRRFAEALSWDVIGQRTVREYRAVVDCRAKTHAP